MNKHNCDYCMSLIFLFVFPQTNFNKCRIIITENIHILHALQNIILCSIYVCQFVRQRLTFLPVYSNALFFAHPDEDNCFDFIRRLVMNRIDERQNVNLAISHLHHLKTVMLMYISIGQLTAMQTDDGNKICLCIRAKFGTHTWNSHDNHGFRLYKSIYSLFFLAVVRFNGM